MKTKLIVMVTALLLILGNEIAHAMCGEAMGAPTGMATMGSMKFMGADEAVGPIARSGGGGMGGHGGMGGGGMGGGSMGSGGMGGDSMGSGHGDMEQGPGNPSGQTEDETTGSHGDH